MVRRPLLITVLTATAALVGTLAIVPLTQANAARPPDAAIPAGLAPEMITEVARTFQISPDQALARLTREARFTHTEQTLRDELGTGFGGAYLNADATTLTVGITRPAQAHRVRALGGTPKLVRHSETQLKALSQRLDRYAATAPKGIPGWYPDAHHNTVTVLHHPGRLDAARAWVTASGVDTAGVRYEQSTETPQTMIDIIGGNAYYIGSGSRCSIGFSVNGGFVTAGHCGRTGASTTQPSGTFAGSSFPGNDYAWVRVAAGNTPRALVNRYPGTVTVNGSRASGVGTSVCRSGSTTGWRCGTIQQLNASVTYPQGTVSGLVRTTACAEPGDSGGSWLTGDQAQGVTSGGSGNCSSGGTTYYQPVTEILSVYGLTLVTGTTPPSPTPTPTPTQTTSPPPGGGCGGLAAWNASTSYTPNDLVSHNSRRYKSTWWSTGAEPGAPASWAVWEDQGSC